MPGRAVRRWRRPAQDRVSKQDCPAKTALVQIHKSNCAAGRIPEVRLASRPLIHMKSGQNPVSRPRPNASPSRPQFTRWSPPRLKSVTSVLAAKSPRCLNSKPHHECAIGLNGSSLIVGLDVGRRQREAFVGVLDLHAVVEKLARIDIITGRAADAPAIRQSQGRRSEEFLLLHWSQPVGMPVTGSTMNASASKLYPACVESGPKLKTIAALRAVVRPWT